MPDRPYQAKCLSEVKEDFDNGIERLLAVLATGLGKTYIAARIPQWFPKKQSMFFAHTDELVRQAYTEQVLRNPYLKVGIEMAGLYAPDDCDIVCASVGTLGTERGASRLGRFTVESCGSVTIDEAHHSPNDTYERILYHYGLIGNTDRTGRLLLGLTATPNRTDGLGLARIFDKVSYTYGLLDAIRDGYLCNLRGVRVRTQVSLDGVRTSGDDLNKSELALAVNTPARNRLIVQEWLKHGEGRKTIGFTVDVQHAKDLAAEFVAAGVRAAAVWGLDPERKEKIAAHKRGDLDILLNANVLIEGYDDRSIKCVLLACPTKSQLRYIQRLGRGTRLPHGVDNLLEALSSGAVLDKVDCMVLDFTDSSTRHSLVTLPSIFGLPPKLSLNGKNILEAVDEFEEARLQRPETDFSDLEDLSSIHSYIERVDLFEVKYAPEVEENSKMQWHRTASGEYILLLPRGERIDIAKDLLGHWNIKGVVQGNEFEDTERDLSEAFGRADTMLRYFGRNLMSLVRRDMRGGKAKEPATTSQINAIRFHLKQSRKTVPDLSGLTKHDASKLLRKLQAA